MLQKSQYVQYGVTLNGGMKDKWNMENLHC